jgi:hypothetical protein
MPEKHAPRQILSRDADNPLARVNCKSESGGTPTAQPEEFQPSLFPDCSVDRSLGVDPKTEEAPFPQITEWSGTVRVGTSGNHSHPLSEVVSGEINRANIDI